MKNLLQNLEVLVADFGQATKLEENTITNAPQALQQLHLFKIFGDNLFEVPATYLIEDDPEAPSIPFRFLNTEEDLEIFSSEFREFVPANFVPFGYFNASEIALFDSNTSNVHSFHVADVIDKGSMEYNLENILSSFQEFIMQLREQNIACFINPKNFGNYDLFEIHDGKNVAFSFGWRKVDGNSVDGKGGLIPCTDRTSARTEYLKLINESLDSGFKLHYGPQWLQAILNQQS